MDVIAQGSTQLSPVVAQRYLASHKKAWLVDVREPEEYEQVHLAGSRLVPLETLPDALKNVPKDQDIVLYCASGGRSSHALAWARSEGFMNVKHIHGGIRAWYSLGLPCES